MSSLKLYRANGVSSFIPHLLLKESGIQFESVVMKPGSDGWESEDGSISNANYRKIHPSGYVPALSAEGEIITELPAILNYIGSLASPDRNLLGADRLQRAKVAEWLAWLSGTLHAQGIAMVFRPGRFIDDASQHDAIRQKGKSAVIKGLTRINDQLTNAEHPVGGQETVVDFALPIFWYWSKRMGLTDLHEQFPSLGVFVKRMEQKPSLIEVAKVEGLDAFLG